MNYVVKRARESACLFALLAVFCFQSAANTVNEEGKISGEVNISFREEKLAARLNYEYVAGAESELVVKFYLGEEFSVKNVKCRICQSFNVDRQTKPAPTLLVNLREPLASGKRLAIEIEYDGNLKGIYKKEHEFLELGLDNFWFPIHPSISQFNFLYRLAVKTDEPDFLLAGNGRAQRKGKSWLIESKVPDFDIDLVSSRHLKFNSYREQGYNLQVVSTNLPPETPATLLENIREILEFYNSSFGADNPQREVVAVLRPFGEIEGQGGYFRKGYFILPKYDDPKIYFFPVAHELAHYWFLGADRQNAWLNESFAEYAAMIALRKKRGAESFNKMLEQKKKNSAGLPAIYGFDRNKNPRQSPMVLYSKGVVKLNELENELGEEKFLALFRRTIAERVKTTDEFLGALAKTSSPEAADKFLAKLKE